MQASEEHTEVNSTIHLAMVEKTNRMEEFIKILSLKTLRSQTSNICETKFRSYKKIASGIK